jgi:hypothetical protein
VFFEANIVAEKKKAQEKTAKDQEEANKKAGQKRKENQAKIKAEIDSITEMNRKSARENELNAMEAQEREVAIINDKFKEQIDKAKKFKQDYSDIEVQRLNEVNAINTKYEDAKKLKEEEKEKTELEAQKAFEEQLFSLRAESNQKTLEGFNIAQQTEIDELKKQLDAKLISLEQYNQGKKAIEDFYGREREKVLQSEADYEIAQREKVQTAVLGIADGTVALLNAVAGKNKGLALSALALEKGAAIANVVINAAKEMSANAAAAALNPLNATTFGAAGAAQLIKSNLLTKIRAGLAIATISATGISSAKGIVSGGAASGGGGTSGGGVKSTPTTSLGKEEPQQTPTMNLNNGQTQSASYQTKERVIVVDYNDISDKGKELEKSRKMVTLA